MPSPSLTTPVTADRLAALRPDGVVAPAGLTAFWVRAALDAGLLDLPLPGRGATADRFAALSAYGRVDLDLARLAEAHTDAVAVLADLEPDRPDRVRDGLWGVWAANPPVDPLRAEPYGSGWRLEGVKPWCSGAGTCDHALVTALTGDGYRLFAVDLDPRHAEAVPGTWPASAMQGSDSRSVRFTAAPADEVGAPGAYLARPGFWHGAVGVAAVWLGGARGVAAALSASAGRRDLHPHAAAHAGAVDASLAAAQALLEETARATDADPEDAAGRARLLAGRVRAAVEQTAGEVVARVGRALGAAPLALDAAHGKRVADLGLYLRQSHAERDLEEHGRLALEQWPW